MELADIEAFLLLCDELHFGRTAERLYVSTSRVSQRIRALELEVGGALFARSSRRVTLTPLGSRLRDDLQPIHADLTAALARARTAARSPAERLRVGFTATTAGIDLDRLVLEFERAQLDCMVQLHELPLEDPVTPLRAGEVDVLIEWLVVDESDLTVGPAFAEHDRVLAVGAGHPLAHERSVSAEVLGDYPAINWTMHGGAMDAVRRAITPPYTPSGRPIRAHSTPVRTVTEGLSLVGRGLAVHPTVASMSQLCNRHGVVLVPIRDLPSLPLGPVWCTSREDAPIRALAGIADSIGTARRERRDRLDDDGSRALGVGELVARPPGATAHDRQPTGGDGADHGDRGDVAVR